jgi:hypothetical protein
MGGGAAGAPAPQAWCCDATEVEVVKYLDMTVNGGRGSRTSKSMVR